MVAGKHLALTLLKEGREGGVESPAMFQIAVHQRAQHPRHSVQAAVSDHRPHPLQQPPPVVLRRPSLLPDPLQELRPLIFPMPLHFLPRQSSGQICQRPSHFLFLLFLLFLLLLLFGLYSRLCCFGMFSAWGSLLSEHLCQRGGVGLLMPRAFSQQSRLLFSGIPCLLWLFYIHSSSLSQHLQTEDSIEKTRGIEISIKFDKEKNENYLSKKKEGFSILKNKRACLSAKK